MALPKAWSLAFGILTAAGVSAHEAPSPQPVASPVAPSDTTLAAASPATPPEERPRAEAPPLVIDTQAALWHHPHNKIVHFPIALGTAGALMLLLSYRWPQFGAGARLLLVAAALSAWMAVRSGEAQEADLEGGELGEWLERHENLGKWTAWAFTLTAITALIKQARPIHWLLALIALGLVSYTGFLGGILSHTPV